MMLTSKQKQIWTTLKYGYDPCEVLETNGDVIRAINISKRLDTVIEPLANYISALAFKYFQQQHYSGYTFREDMVSHATLVTMKSIMRFDTDLDNNTTAYMSTCFRSAAVNYIHKERKQWEIKEELTARIANGQHD